MSNSPSLREAPHFRRVVGGVVVDRMRAVVINEHLMLADGGGAERGDVRHGPAKLKHRSANAAGGHLHEHRFACAQIGSKEQHMVRSEISYR